MLAHRKLIIALSANHQSVRATVSLRSGWRQVGRRSGSLCRAARTTGFRPVASGTGSSQVEPDLDRQERKKKLELRTEIPSSRSFCSLRPLIPAPGPDALHRSPMSRHRPPPPSASHHSSPRDKLPSQSHPMMPSSKALSTNRNGAMAAAPKGRSAMVFLPGRGPRHTQPRAARMPRENVVP